MTSYEPESYHRETPRRRKRIIKTKTIKKETTKEIETPEGTFIKQVSSERVVRIERTTAGVQRETTAMRALHANRQPMVPGSVEAFRPFPQQWKLSLRGVTLAGGRSVDELNGDYILDLVYADAGAARWEHVFPAQFGLFRAALDITSKGNEFWLRASLSGLDPGPTWCGLRRSIFDAATLHLENLAAAKRSLSWPGQVVVSPLGLPAESSGEAAIVAKQNWECDSGQWTADSGHE